jgi:protein SCO1/2
MTSSHSANAPGTNRRAPSMPPPVDGRGGAGLLAAPFVLVACLGLIGCQPVRSGTPANTTDAGPAPEAATTSAKAAAVSSTAASGGPPATPECCAKPDDVPTPPAVAAVKAEAQPLPGGFRVPRAVLIDQDGKAVNLYDDLVKGRVVVMNFIFTTCRGICPPLGANFAALQKQLGDASGDDISLISISVDPVTDTPQRLKAWAKQFGARPGWTLLTGPKADVDSVLKSLGVFAANKNEHSPYLIIGSEAAGQWRRFHGLTSPERVAEVARQLVREGRTSRGSGDGPRPSAAPAEGSMSAAHKYFTDVALVNQRGEEMRLYSDLLRDKIVVIKPFFAECKGSCPRMMATFARIQDHMADRLGKDVHLISISVDPGRDTPERLAEYAAGLKARPGWYFLTGARPNVDAALQKLGLRVDAREAHSNIFLIGNLRTGLWKKAMGLADPADILAIVDGVLEDRPTTPDSPPNSTDRP